MIASRQHDLRIIRWCLAIFVLGLFVSGVTAFPLQTELSAILRWMQRPMVYHMATATHVLPWFTRVTVALADTNARYPFLSYGTDWLAFAHILFAVLFVGPMVDPVRNKWVTVSGIVACAAIPFLAFIAGPMRGIPLPWRFIDTSFGVFGCIPLFFVLQRTNRMEKHATQQLA